MKRRSHGPHHTSHTVKLLYPTSHIARPAPHIPLLLPLALPSVHARMSAAVVSGSHITPLTAHSPLIHPSRPTCLAVGPCQDVGCGGLRRRARAEGHDERDVAGISLRVAVGHEGAHLGRWEGGGAQEMSGLPGEWLHLGRKGGAQRRRKPRHSGSKPWGRHPEQWSQPGTKFNRTQFQRAGRTSLVNLWGGRPMEVQPTSTVGRTSRTASSSVLGFGGPE